MSGPQPFVQGRAARSERADHRRATQRNKALPVGQAKRRRSETDATRMQPPGALRALEHRRSDIPAGLPGAPQAQCCPFRPLLRPPSLCSLRGRACSSRRVGLALMGRASLDQGELTPDGAPGQGSRQQAGVSWASRGLVPALNIVGAARPGTLPGTQR